MLGLPLPTIKLLKLNSILRHKNTDFKSLNKLVDVVFAPEGFFPA